MSDLARRLNNALGFLFEEEGGKTLKDLRKITFKPGGYNNNNLGWTPEEIVEVMKPYIIGIAKKYSLLNDNYGHEEALNDGAYAIYKALDQDKGIQAFVNYAFRWIRSSLARGSKFSKGFRGGFQGWKVHTNNYDAFGDERGPLDTHGETYTLKRSQREKKKFGQDYETIPEKAEEFNDKWLGIGKHKGEPGSYKDKMAKEKAAQQWEGEGEPPQELVDKWADKIKFDEVWDVRPYNVEEVYTGAVSTQQAIGGEEEGQIGDILPYRAPDPLNVLANKEMIERLMELADLTDLQREVLKLSYGLGEETTFGEPETWHPEHPKPSPKQQKVKPGKSPKWMEKGTPWGTRGPEIGKGWGKHPESARGKYLYTTEEPFAGKPEKKRGRTTAAQQKGKFKRRGLGGQEVRGTKEIADALGVSKQRINSVRNKALAKMSEMSGKYSDTLFGRKPREGEEGLVGEDRQNMLTFLVEARKIINQELLESAYRGEWFFFRD